MSDARTELFSQLSNLRQILRFAHERRYMADQQSVIAQKVEQALSLATRLTQDPLFADINPSAAAQRPAKKPPRKPLYVRVNPQAEPEGV